MENINEYKVYGKCRCCLSVGNHKDLKREYYKNDIQVVYFETFIDCFNLFLSTSPNLPSLICSECIHRLQDAYDFKTLVINTEKALLSVEKLEPDMPCDPLGPLDDSLRCSESIKSELDDINFENHPEGDVENSDLTNLDEYYNVDGEIQLLNRFEKKYLKNLPNRSTLYKMCPKYVLHLDRLKDKTITAKSIETKLFKKRTIKNDVQISEKLAHAINACTILENSNIVAFKTKMRSGYPCFYCREIYYDIPSLRNHQKNHSKSNLFKIITKYRSDSLVVYADITNLRCSICDTGIQSLSDLKNHLKTVHAKRLYDYPDRVIPFKIIGGCNYKCQICGFNFETFGAVERHMNVHYRNYVCDKCGAGFITNHRLKVHAHTQHKDGVHPCERCNKIFPSHLKLKIHYNLVHNKMKPNKCIKCSERFIDYFTRQKHMVDKHGLKPISYKCNACEKTFSRRYSLSIHQKRCHLDEKDVKCDLCPYTCFTKSELNMHSLKHGGGEMFECGVCKKSYARKKTLKEHMRIHNNDRRFVCAVCGQAFVQNCSLKQHLNAQHCNQY